MCVLTFHWFLLTGSWYVSNVSIIFDCSMLLYILFWMFNGLYYTLLYFFGTNLLTKGQVQIAIFCLFQCFAKKEYQTESKRNETFGKVIFGMEAIQGLGVHVREASRWPRGREERPPPLGAPPPLWAPRGSTDRLPLPIYIYIPWKHTGAPRNPISTAATFYTREIPSWGLFRRSAGGGNRSRMASTSTP